MLQRIWAAKSGPRILDFCIVLDLSLPILNIDADHSGASNPALCLIADAFLCGQKSFMLMVLWSVTRLIITVNNSHYPMKQAGRGVH